MNFDQSVEYIHSLLAFGIKPGLERISMLLDLLGNPQDKLKIIHVAGTNGKGSTSTTISNMLIAGGKKTGLFTSPYVIDFCERIQIDGKNVSKNLFADCVTEVREKIEELKQQVSHLERENQALKEMQKRTTEAINEKSRRGYSFQL